MNKWIIIGAFISSNGFASEIATLENGQKAQLNDDFTWEYLVPQNEKTTHVTAIPLTTKKMATTFKVGDDKNILQLSNSSVDILLQSASYQSGTLTIPTSITNQGSQSIILIELEVEILDPQGLPLVKTQVSIWKSIKRLADTYLRPQSSQQGQDIELELPQHADYQINVKVINVESR